MNSSRVYPHIVLFSQLTVRGLTGDLRLDSSGRREEFQLDILEITKNANRWTFFKEATWDPVNRITKPSTGDAPEEIGFSVSGMTLKVVTVPVSIGGSISLSSFFK